MNPTTQSYSFDTQEDLVRAVGALSDLDTSTYDLLSSGEKISDLDGGVSYELNVLFVDLATVCVPFCETIFPSKDI